MAVVIAIGGAFVACASSVPAVVSPAQPTVETVSKDAMELSASTPSARVAATPTASPTSVGPRPASRGIPVPTVTAGAIFIMDEATGASLFELNADARLSPASLTKIATAIVAIESGADLETVIEVHPNLEQLWLEDSSAMGLLPGDQFSLRELLYGLLLVSGNDAAKELAIALYGSEAAFIDAMNALVRRLGLRDTHFLDPHGLGGPGHYTSARDMAILSKYAMTLPLFREIVGTETHTATGTQELFLYNYNPLLNYTPGVTGVKTGYTEEAGPTFAVSVDRDGRRIILVLLNAPAFPFDAIDLIEWAYADTIWP